MDAVKRARQDARLARTLENDKALDLFCEVILRGRRERDLAIAQRQTILRARPMIYRAALRMDPA